MAYKVLYNYDLNGTVVIDGRGKTSEEICKIARDVLFGKGDSSIFLEDEGENGDHGFLLSDNLIHYYNVKSVCDGIVVASLKEMTPDQTRPLAEQFKGRLHDSH